MVGGSKGSGGNGVLVLPTHTSAPSQQAGGHHQGQSQKIALIGFLSLLLTVNLMYFVKTHTRMDLLAASAGGAGCAGSSRRPTARSHLPRAALQTSTVWQAPCGQLLIRTCTLIPY